MRLVYQIGESRGSVIIPSKSKAIEIAKISQKKVITYKRVNYCK